MVIEFVSVHSAVIYSELNALTYSTYYIRNIKDSTDD